MIPFDINQAGWNSRQTYDDGYRKPWWPDKWVVHYGGNALAAGSMRSVTAETSALRSWQRYHMDSRGWLDIAYNYAIGQSGTIYRLRGENRAGATRGDFELDGIPENHEARSVVFILGGEQIPTEEALAAFEGMWAADPMTVIVHKDVHLRGSGGTNTQCPGSYLTEWVRNEGYRDGVEDEDMAILTEDEQLKLQRFLEVIEEEDSNVGFVKWAIRLIRRDKGTEIEKGASALEAVEELKQILRGV